MDPIRPNLTITITAMTTTTTTTTTTAKTTTVERVPTPTTDAIFNGTNATITVENTTASTSTDILLTSTQSKNVTGRSVESSNESYPTILAIVLPIIACIIVIVIIVFLAQRRGAQKRAKSESNLKVTPKANQGNEPSNPNQPNTVNGLLDFNNATSSGMDLNRARAATAVKVAVETPKSTRAQSVDSPRKSWRADREGARSEPQYVNFTQTQATNPGHKDDEVDSSYIDLNSPQSQTFPNHLGIANSNFMTSPASGQPRSRPVSRVSQPQPVVVQDPSRVFYENLQRSPDGSDPGPNRTIYQNTQGDDNLYEEAMKKEDGDIYVDMQ